MAGRTETVIVAAAVAIVAVCLAVALWAAGVPWTFAAVTALLAMVAVLPLVRRVRRRTRKSPLPDVEGFQSEIARLNAKVLELEAKISEVDMRVLDIGRSTARAVASELDTVGAVMRDLAETVAMHDAELFAPRSTRAADPAHVAATPQPVSPPEPPTLRGSLAAERTEAEPSRRALLQPQSASEVPSGSAVSAALEQALREGSIEVMLQGVVTLPQRRVRLYEALTRLRGDAGVILEGAEVERAAQQAGLSRELDRFVLPHVIRVARHLAGRGRDVPVVFRTGPATLLDAALFRMLAAAFAQDSGLASRILFEVPLATFRDAEALEREALDALEGLGVRFVLDQVPDLVLEARSLAQRGVRYVKVGASVIIGAGQGKVPAEIHPADLAGYLARHGVSLVAADVEDEATAVEVFEFDVPLGIGTAYAPPRAVKLDVLEEIPAAASAEAQLPASSGVERAAGSPSPAPPRPLRPQPAAEDALAANRPAAEPERPRGTPLRAFLRRTSG
jgi:cyclic-di-GMP phosphodiesterase TipF (flagellum assembly factor)